MPPRSGLAGEWCCLRVEPASRFWIKKRLELLVDCAVVFIKPRDFVGTEELWIDEGTVNRSHRQRFKLQHIALETCVFGGNDDL